MVIITDWISFCSWIHCIVLGNKVGWWFEWLLPWISTLAYEGVLSGCGLVGEVGLLRCCCCGPGGGPGVGLSRYPSPESILRPLITGPTVTCLSSRSLEAPVRTSSNNWSAREHLKRYFCGPSGPLRPDSKIKNPVSSTPYWRRYLKSKEMGSLLPLQKTSRHVSLTFMWAFSGHPWKENG